jgi:DNA-binding LytR/AlgR family response regulator
MVRRIRCPGYVGTISCRSSELVSLASDGRKSKPESDARHSIMSVGKIHDQKGIAREMFVQHAAHAHAEVSASPPQRDAICSTKNKCEDTFESTAEDGSYEPVDTSLLPVTRVDAANLIRAWRRLAVIAIRQAPRIAFKVKGRILFLELAEIMAVQAEGNYVSLQHRPNPYFLRESLSSMAEKLKPYGFIRIHRSVVVNISAVVEIQPLPTGEYRLRVKGGKEYLVTRTYKDSLRDLAQLWVGSECLCGEQAAKAP